MPSTGHVSICYVQSRECERVTPCMLGTALIALAVRLPAPLATRATQTPSRHTLHTHSPYTNCVPHSAHSQSSQTPQNTLKLQLACRLLEEVASSYNSTTLLLPSTALLGSLGHTRVLRIAPVSSVIGPPSFPNSSAALEEESESQPLMVSQAARGPQPLGGLSRSLSASASSSSGLMPNGNPTDGTIKSGMVTSV